jgi:carbon-monoxide dehydrogenase large subunit
MAETAERYTGSSVPRKEDPALLTGRANRTDNIKLLGMLPMSVLRSPYAHANVTSIRHLGCFEAAGHRRGLYRRGPDSRMGGGIHCGWPVTEYIKTPGHWPLAREEVNHEGDGMVLVVATDRYKAQDAPGLAEVD